MDTALIRSGNIAPEIWVVIFQQLDQCGYLHEGVEPPVPLRAPVALPRLLFP